MSGLPKKYAKMGFKAGWKAYKRSKNTRKGRVSTTKRKISTVRTMARKRRRPSLRARYKRASSRGVSAKQLILPAMAYGAVRAKIAAALTPISSKVPFGSISDELVLGVAAYFVAKKSKNKMLKDFARSALAVEAASAGQALAIGGLGGGATSSTSGTPVI